MPRHLIGDAHEWINEIPTVPTRSRVNLQPSQRSWDYLCVKILSRIVPIDPCFAYFITRIDARYEKLCHMDFS